MLVKTAATFAVTVAALLPAQSAAAATACAQQPANPLYDYGPTTIRAQAEASGLVTEPLLRGTEVEVHAYTQPSTAYSVVRRHVLTEGGRFQTTLVPARNTRFLVQATHPNCGTQKSPSQVVSVAPTISLDTQRNAVRDYTFSGRFLPAREGKVISLYRLVGEGERVLTSQTRVRADGTYRFDRRFTGSGQWNFSVAAGVDLQNVQGFSPARFTVIH